MRNEIKHPVDDIHTLEHRRHLQYIYRQVNLPTDATIGDRTIEVSSDELIREYAIAVVRHLETAMNAEAVAYTDFAFFRDGRDFSDLSVEATVKTLVIAAAHAIPFSHLPSCLRSSSAVCDELGYSDPDVIRSSTWYREIHREAANHDHRSATDANRKAATSSRVSYATLIKHLAHRCAAAAFREGVPVPTRFHTQYGLDWETGLWSEIPHQTRRVALQDWVRWIITRVFSHLDFQYEQPQEKPIHTIAGTAAQSAVQQVSTENAWKTLPPSCSRTGYKQVNAVLSRLNIRDVEDQFKKVHNEFFAIAQELGCFTDSIHLAFDPTTVPTKADDNWTINDGSTQGQARIYTLLSIVDNAPRFGIGSYLTRSKTDEVSYLDRLLRQATTVLPDCERVYIDAEFHNEDAIKTCRRHLGDNWVINASPADFTADDKPDLPTLPDIGRSVWEDVTVGQTSVNAVWYHPFVGDSDRETVYLTDLPYSNESGVTGQTVHRSFNNRKTIETTIGDLKADFIPYTESSKPEIKLFMFHLGLLFYNIYILVNELPSPKLKIDTDVIPQQVLTAIVCATMDSSNPV